MVEIVETGEASRAWNRTEFVAKELARADSKNWDRLPESASWFKDRMHYRMLAIRAEAAGRLWDAKRTYDCAVAGWRDMNTAPKDGSVIDLTWMEDGQPQEIWPMQWGHIQQNGLFPGQTGMWVSPDGQLTWNDRAGGGPTHWRPHREAEDA